jgi:hypothetical protein
VVSATDPPAVNSAFLAGAATPDGCFIPKETGRLTVGRNIRLDSTQITHEVSLFVAMSPSELAPENDYAGEDQQQL